MYWMRNMYKNPNKDRFIIACPKSLIKRRDGTITSVIRLFF